jgi:hypothetical protein
MLRNDIGKVLRVLLLANPLDVPISACFFHGECGLARGKTHSTLGMEFDKNGPESRAPFLFPP